MTLEAKTASVSHNATADTVIKRVDLVDSGDDDNNKSESVKKISKRRSKRTAGKTVEYANEVGDAPSDSELSEEKPAYGSIVYPKLSDEKVTNDEDYVCIKDDAECKFMKGILDFLRTYLWGISKSKSRAFCQWKQLKLSIANRIRFIVFQNSVQACHTQRMQCSLLVMRECVKK